MNISIGRKLSTTNYKSCLKNCNEEDALPFIHSFCKEQRDIEKRADLNAAYNSAGRDADPEILAQHVEDLICWLRFTDIFVDQRRLKGKKPEEYALLDHPLVPVRVAYLKKLAAGFRQQKAVQVIQQSLKKQKEERLISKVSAFAKQQREELGKLFRGELKK